MTILFDIGNVLLRFDYKDALLALIPSHLPDPQERLKLLDEKRDDLESGRIGADDFIAWSLQTLGSSAQPKEFVRAWRSIFTPIHETWDLAARLKATDHRLILFSNINPLHSPWIYEAYSVFSLFDGAVMSFEIGCMKPMPEFYTKASELYQLDPRETVYIDDLPANIEAGKNIGFHCHLYDHRNHQALEDFLTKLLR